jgi:hypothetical protein
MEKKPETESAISSEAAWIAWRKTWLKTDAEIAEQNKLLFSVPEKKADEWDFEKRRKPKKSKKTDEESESEYIRCPRRQRRKFSPESDSEDSYDDVTFREEDEESDEKDSEAEFHDGDD